MPQADEQGNEELLSSSSATPFSCGFARADRDQVYYDGVDTLRCARERCRAAAASMFARLERDQVYSYANERATETTSVAHCRHWKQSPDHQLTPAAAPPSMNQSYEFLPAALRRLLNASPVKGTGCAGIKERSLEAGIHSPAIGTMDVGSYWNFGCRWGHRNRHFWITSPCDRMARRDSISETQPCRTSTQR